MSHCGFLCWCARTTRDVLVALPEERSGVYSMRHESANTGTPPDALKGKMLLKHARVDEKHQGCALR
eukprot:6475119-Amphidinium_carterae.2